MIENILRDPIWNLPDFACLVFVKIEGNVANAKNREKFRAVVPEKESKTCYFRDILGNPQPRLFDKSKSPLAGTAQNRLHYRVERKMLRY